MTYPQVTLEERYHIQSLRRSGLRPAAIARAIERHRSTVTRELERNVGLNNWYDAARAQAKADVRRAVSRRNRRISLQQWKDIRRLLEAEWSPEQIAGHLRTFGQVRICHGTIYNYIWLDRAAGGELCRYLPHGGRRRVRYGRHAGRTKWIRGRSIDTRPTYIMRRRQLGHWEIDTMVGPGPEAILTLVERKTGYVLIGKVRSKSAADVTRRAIALIRAHRRKMRTITADNGTEFAGHRRIERLTGVRFYFAHPYHAWERGTNENTNGLIRRYWPKGQSFSHITQYDCNALAHRLNTRPRKRLGWRTPEDCYANG